jgi:hypothetical protein
MDKPAGDNGRKKPRRTRADRLMKQESEAYLHGLSTRRSAVQPTQAATPSPTVSALASTLASNHKRHERESSAQDAATSGQDGANASPERISSYDVPQETGRPTPERASSIIPALPQTYTPTTSTTRKRSIAAVDHHLDDAPSPALAHDANTARPSSSQRQPATTPLYESMLKLRAARVVLDLSTHTAEQTRTSSDSSWIFIDGQGTRIELQFPESFLRKIRGETMEAITSESRVAKSARKEIQSTTTPLGQTVPPLPAHLGTVSSQANGQRRASQAFPAPRWREDHWMHP